MLKLRVARKLRLRRDVPRFILRDVLLDYHGGPEMLFEGMVVGSVVAVDTLSFPFIGRVVSFNDQRVTLADAVKILWDGRHGQFAGRGNVPESAEVELTYPEFHISVDAVIGWGVYPGGKIPAEQ